MDILKNEILPLFEVTQSTNLSDMNKDELIQVALNQYSLYVDLKDVYLNKSQQHSIEIEDNTLQYTIPLYYHEIILSGKGYYKDDIVINICSKVNYDFLRINTHDLFSYRKVVYLKDQVVVENQYKFIHIDDVTEVVVDLVPGKKMYKLEGIGLPKPDRSRGNLYVWLDSDNLVTVENESSSSSSSSSSGDEKEDKNADMLMLLEVLNYHQNSNVV